MKNISVKTAARTINILLFLAVLFHVLTMSGIISMDNAWGGRVSDRQQFMMLELVSISIVIFALMIVSMRAGFMSRMFSISTIKVLLWIFVVVFALNTIGNIMTIPAIEGLIGTPITLVITILMLVLALNKDQFPRVRR